MMSIYRVLFGPNYVVPTSIIEFDFMMRLAWDKCSLRDVDFGWQRPNLAR